MANRDVARQVLEIITEHPENHDQSTWCEPGVHSLLYISTVEDVTGCGTTMCVAGWAALVDEYKIDTSLDLAVKGRSRMTIRAAGERALGVDFRLVNELFYLANNRRAVDILTQLAETGEFNEND